MARAVFIVALIILVWAQDSNSAIAQVRNGQLSTGPAAPNSSSQTSTAGNTTAAPPSSASNSYNANSATSPRIVAPTSTVGNTPSSLQSGGGSGYSAGSSTVNGNINNSAVGNRSGDQPISSANQTANSSSSRSNINQNRK